MNKALIAILVLAAVLVCGEARASCKKDCTNVPVYNEGNCYDKGEYVVGEDDILYKALKGYDDSNCSKKLSNGKYWEARGKCDSDCSRVPAFRDGKKYSKGSKVQRDGVIYQTCRNSDYEYPDEYLFNNPWEVIGTCYFNCDDTCAWNRHRIYRYNDVVYKRGKLYQSQQGWVNLEPKENNGQGEPWFIVDYCY